jgi:hypothetical protein
MERRRLNELIREIDFAAMDALWTDGDVALARARLAAGFAEHVIPEDRMDNAVRRLEEDIALWQLLHQMPRNVKPVSDLHRLALDGQNVHTKEVAGQTNDAVTLLIGTDIATDQETLEEIAAVWSDKPKAGLRVVLKDMGRWYKTATCRVDDDWLYKRALDGLWATIRVSKFKTDLVQRLWEEAEESLGMCCEGHISRVCNVLVGFDEAFKPEIPVGLLLQQKMAAIAAKDITVERKVGEAWVVFEELNIPREQRLDWLDAF